MSRERGVWRALQTIHANVLPRGVAATPLQGRRYADTVAAPPCRNKKRLRYVFFRSYIFPIFRASTFCPEGEVTKESFDA
jgi:hypothetical protein